MKPIDLSWSFPLFSWSVFGTLAFHATPYNYRLDCALSQPFCSEFLTGLATVERSGSKSTPRSCKTRTFDDIFTHEWPVFPKHAFNSSSFFPKCSTLRCFRCLVPLIHVLLEINLSASKFKHTASSISFKCGSPTYRLTVGSRILNDRCH